MALTDLGTGIGPMLLGLMVPVAGYREMYMVCALISLLSMAMYWMMTKRMMSQSKRFYRRTA